MPIQDPTALLDRLLSSRREAEWVEFKLNQFSHDAVGRYVSGLANSAVFSDVDCAYMVWGVSDEFDVVGTSVSIANQRVGNDTFLFWLTGRLSPRIVVEHAATIYRDRPVEILAIAPSYQQPVRFNGEAFIRIDTSLQPLANHPERERAIWHATSRFSFEQTIARSHCDIDQIYKLFDIENLLQRLGVNRPSVGNAIEYLEQDGFIRDNDQGRFDVTNLLVLVSAVKMKSWSGFERKAPRVVTYKHKSKLDAVSDVQGGKSYGLNFTPMLRYIMDRVEHREEMRHGRRTTVFDIPEIAIREVVANAIIHQDLTVPGDGPLIEIHPDKIRVSNPGRPLIPTDRFIDSPSKSRNARFGKIMRRLGLCEERGSGVDRALEAIEKASLPPPLFQAVADSTVVTLYGPKQFADMTREERVRASYQHACLGFERNEFMSNASLRHRFALSDKQYPQVSNVIAEAREAGLIRPLDEDQAKRNARYLPYWA